MLYKLYTTNTYWMIPFYSYINMDFPRPDLGPNICPFPLKNEQKLPKLVYIISNFLFLHFSENFMKICTKIQKLQMHENLHKNVNENLFHSHFYSIFHEFLSWAIKATNML